MQTLNLIAPNGIKIVAKQIFIPIVVDGLTYYSAFCQYVSDGLEVIPATDSMGDKCYLIPAKNIACYEEGMTRHTFVHTGIHG